MRNIKLFFWAEIFAHINFLTPVMTLFYLHRGLAYSDLFIILIIWVVTVFIFEVPTGTFADRFGPKVSFLVGHSCAILALILLLFAREPLLFYLSAAASACGFTFFSGSDQAFVYETLKEMHRESEMSAVWGKIKSAALAPAVITILIGAYVARDLKENQFLLLIGLAIAFSFVTLILLMFIKSPQSFQVQRRIKSLQYFKIGFMNISGNKNLMLLFVNETLVMIPTYVIIAQENLIQPYFKQAGIPVALFGIIYALDSAGNYFILNKIRQVERRINRRRLIYITGIGIALLFLAAALTEITIPMALFLFFGVRFLFWLRHPLFQQIKNDWIPSSGRATTLSVLSMIDSGFDILILSLLGFISATGIQLVFLICAVIVVIGLIFPVREKSGLNE